MSVASSAISSFIDPARIDALLVPWVADPEDRRFVVRCILGEGPAHHRGSNWVLLALLGLVLERMGGAPAVPADAAPSVPVPMRVPPHISDTNGARVFPLRLPTGALDLIVPAGSREQSAMIDCLTDGPPQHSLANAAMMCLIESLLRCLPGTEP